MKAKKAIKMIDKILKECDCEEAGVFISILCYDYMKIYNASQKDFLKSLKNSLVLIEKEEKNEK